MAENDRVHFNDLLNTLKTNLDRDKLILETLNKLSEKKNLIQRPK